VAGWGRIVTGAIIGVAGTIYATNEEARKNLPKAARDFPVRVKERFQSAVNAGREASSTRREEILRDLEDHGGGDATARSLHPNSVDELTDVSSVSEPIPDIDETVVLDREDIPRDPS
jgi:hypothetical protein